MIEISFNRFRANILRIVNKAIVENIAIRVKCSPGKDFIVISADEWEREQETLYVLMNKLLMNQLAESLVSFNNNTGFKPTQEQLEGPDCR